MTGQAVPELLKLRLRDVPEFVPPICPGCEKPVDDGPAFVDSDGVYHNACFKRYVVGGHAVGPDD